MRRIDTGFEGLILIEPRTFEDARGAFLETWREERYRPLGIDGPFVQDNLSISRRNVLRGLHHQRRRPQGKLISVCRGAVFDVVVDLRPDAPTYLKTFTLELSAANRLQLYVPPGFAHGFCALEDDTTVLYKCTEVYDPSDEAGIRYDDPTLAIAWPVVDPILSARDAALPFLGEEEG
jgi:dTDP-4-dehydrorhamnose 3,5-epimerase